MLGCEVSLGESFPVHHGWRRGLYGSNQAWCPLTARACVHMCVCVCLYVCELQIHCPGEVSSLLLSPCQIRMSFEGFLPSTSTTR